MTAAQDSGAPRPKKQKTERAVLEAVPIDQDHPGNSKFARALGSNDYLTREKGVQALTRWLTRKPDLNEGDVTKIWKGLFYCFWHSDKAPVQAELAERMAGIMMQLSPQAAYLFFAVFIHTIRREWFGIDRLRLDKFLMLIRKFCNQMLVCLKQAKWDGELVQRYAAFLQHEVLVPSDTLSAVGVAYHISDLLLDELRSVAGDKAVPGAALLTLLAPFGVALQKGDQVAIARIREGVYDTLLDDLRSAADAEDEEAAAAGAYLRKLDVPQLAAALFDLGAMPETRARNRQALYELSNVLEKVQRKRAKREADAADAGVTAGAKARRRAAQADAGPMPEANNAAEADGVAEGKPKKKKKKAQEQQQAADEEEAPAPVPVPASGLKRKAAALAGGGAEGQTSAAGKAAKGQQQSPAAHAASDGHAVNGIAAGPMANGSPVAMPGQQVRKGAAAQAPGATPTPTTGGKAGKASAPTTGQKAGFRAAVEALGAVANGAGAAGSSAKGTAGPSSAAGTPARAPQEAPKFAQTKGGVSAMTTPMASTQPASGGGSSALGAKRPASAMGSQRHGQDSGAHEAAAGTSDAGAPTTGKKKGVRINLKRNLYFEAGGPLPDPDIRTPPPARPKGSILKKHASHPAPRAPKSAPPKMTGRQHPTQQAGAGVAPGSASAGRGQARRMPGSAVRATAASFF